MNRIESIISGQVRARFAGNSQLESRDEDKKNLMNTSSNFGFTSSLLNSMEGSDGSPRKSVKKPKYPKKFTLD